ncbi:hypothetical protein FY528_19140 [Hymenobacter lutimineralis]|uniref:Uncharacterized protein n=1 Tax=Hymenobacter lutimineralis TaxID=2606448 RepID=A0A5D6UUM9_9BACT|nr:DUF6252 family protein [Hymenobacter lutimineralis]TYZ06144.1 hypothetical protein FY528_19140 [Hymenobacter lutimineralis]
MSVSAHSSLRALLPLLLSATLGACKKDDSAGPQLPEPTQTGANTMGAKVDGQNWRAGNSVMFGPKPLTASVFEYAGAREFSVSGIFSTNDEKIPLSGTSIKLVISDLKAAGTYDLIQEGQPTQGTGSPSYGMFVESSYTPDKWYVTNPAYIGKVVVTRLDTIQHIVSGTFEFKAKEIAGAKIISITDGRFDVIYK